MYPATRAVKKELFPIIDSTGLAKPIIQVIIEEAVESGIQEVCLITQPGDETVFRSYFEGVLDPALEAKLDAKDWAREETRRLRDLSSRLSYVEQVPQDGFGHAVNCCRDWVGGDPCLLMLGDHLYSSSSGKRCARQLLDVYESTPRTVVAVERSSEDQLHLCGTVGAAAGRERVYDVTEFKEKPSVEYARENLMVQGNPERPYLCVFGQYVLSPGVFDALHYCVAHDIREGGEIQFTGALEMARQQEGGALAYETDGKRFDTGVPAEYVRTVAEFAKS